MIKRITLLTALLSGNALANGTSQIQIDEFSLYSSNSVYAGYITTSSASAQCPDSLRNSNFYIGRDDAGAKDVVSMVLLAKSTGKNLTIEWKCDNHGKGKISSANIR